MFLSALTYFGLLSAISFFKTRPINYQYLIISGGLIGLKAIGEPSLGQPKGEYSR